MKKKYFSFTKFEPNTINEDAAIVHKERIAVSDGAGGGGVFAERWSKYLLRHLPATPIQSAEALDKWVDDIAQPYYDACEEDAKKRGGMFLNKFYDEGSFATLVAIWRQPDRSYFWMSYGDSVAFCYDKSTDTLTHSFTELKDFNKPPYLINCNNPLKPEGFRCGTFPAGHQLIVFAASDTLAHYIMAAYESRHQEKYAEELQRALDMETKDSNLVQSLLTQKTNFKKLFQRIIQVADNYDKGKEYLKELENSGYLGHDDYSFVAFDR